MLDRKGQGSLVEVTVKTASIDTGHDQRDGNPRGSDYLDAAGIRR